MIYLNVGSKKLYIYYICKMLSVTEKVARIMGYVLKENSYFFVSKSVGECFGSHPVN